MERVKNLLGLGGFFSTAHLRDGNVDGFNGSFSSPIALLEFSMVLLLRQGHSILLRMMVESTYCDTSLTYECYT